MINLKDSMLIKMQLRSFLSMVSSQCHTTRIFKSTYMWHLGPETTCNLWKKLLLHKNATFYSRESSSSFQARTYMVIKLRPIFIWEGKILATFTSQWASTEVFNDYLLQPFPLPGLKSAFSNKQCISSGNTFNI